MRSWRGLKQTPDHGPPSACPLEGPVWDLCALDLLCQSPRWEPSTLGLEEGASDSHSLMQARLRTAPGQEGGRRREGQPLAWGHTASPSPTSRHSDTALRSDRWPSLGTEEGRGENVTGSSSNRSQPSTGVDRMGPAEPLAPPGPGRGDSALTTSWCGGKSNVYSSPSRRP